VLVLLLYGDFFEIKKILEEDNKKNDKEKGSKDEIK